MKKLKRWLMAILSTSVIFAGLISCSGSGDSSITGEVEPGKIGDIDPALKAAAKAGASMGDSAVLFYYRPDGDYKKWGLWSWEFPGGDGQAGYDLTAGKAQSVTVDGYKIGYWDLTSLVSSDPLLNGVLTNNGQMGIIIRDTGWTKDPGVDQVLDFSVSRKFMVISKDTSVYEVSDTVAPTITSAISTSPTKLKISLSVSLGLETKKSSSGFIVKDADGNQINVIDAINFDAQDDRSKNNARNIILTLGSKLDATNTYFVSHDGFAPEKGLEINLVGALKDLPTYSGTDLGLTLDGKKATFKVWAPIASDVKLLVYASADKVGTFNEEAVKAKNVGSTTDETLKGEPATDPIKMVKDATSGVWTAEIEDVSNYKYYKYQIVNNGKTYYVCDTYAKAASADAIAAQITDINDAGSGAIPTSTTDKAYGTKEAYYNPFGKSGSEQKAYTDAVIYEMHVTDWSLAEDSSLGNVGKYLTIANGDKVIAHIKELGVTHVQILPVFEFAETNDNTDYNWGYNPYHYNLPEGRYVTVGYEDGTQAVLELRTLIAKFHEAGIAVNMDVVYNHTSGTQTGSLYDSQVPAYFYRFTEDGAYSNGSGCGNEVDTEANMAKKYIIESLKHWMLDYHFNGFRFDLMGCISKETMSDIYNALHEIDPNVMVYGEPWTGGECQVQNGATQAVSASSGFGAGAFDDDFRDAVKGAEFGGFKQGEVQGTFDDSALITGLLGKAGKNKRNDTGVLGLGLRYVECHDNYTLFDKLAISYWQRANNKTGTTTGDLFEKIGINGLNEVRAEDKLAASYVLLAQGTAFMNGGQEFLRTKRGDENSYKSSKTTNAIKLQFAESYSDVYNTYKGLIALRKANPAAFGGNKNAKAEKVSSGVIKYTTGDFLVYFNATDKEQTCDTTGYSKVVDVTSGTPAESTTLPSSVPAKGFVILKK